ncbi:IscS subfamily cysteine desulfurase [Pseudomonas ogarae]|uniref:aminotransferase class V-fold PLP-dependent enzyme n=1 Tax=Pseudomonas ogarae (strain DSM 112162 / CECT 30235 / F113) TaxID=1114970 RepID=UPI0009A2E73C|nr:aminotransferase class V-fold PLP-dependent enzyme [Pseudomonas ogarae]OPG72094.1 IscS subfamily cysteine desulfurase [Pseudomonas ogarae]
MSRILPWNWPAPVPALEKNSSEVLYFDYAATTPVDERVIARMVECLGRGATFGNPASTSHAFGHRAKEQVEKARQQVAELVGAATDRIVWTSGATESNNLALKGVACTQAGHAGHIVSSQLEHKAVLDTLKQLEEQGFQVTYLEPDKNGAITADAVLGALREDSFLVSLMLVNNELGTVTDVASIGRLVREHGALFHVDAAQATGKVDIDLKTLEVDLMSFSAHKTYGPKGIGALYAGPRTEGKLRAQIHGGGHEQGLRSGTLATHQIVGMGEAFAIARELAETERAHLSALRERLLKALAGLPITINGSRTTHVPNTLSLTPYYDFSIGNELALSSTSACNSASNEPSHVLMALRLKPSEALRTIRLSLGRYSTEREVDRAAELIRSALMIPIP